MENLSLIFSNEYRASNPHPGNFLIALMVFGALVLAVLTFKIVAFIASKHSEMPEKHLQALRLGRFMGCGYWGL